MKRIVAALAVGLFAAVLFFYWNSKRTIDGYSGNVTESSGEGDFREIGVTESKRETEILEKSNLSNSSVPPELRGVTSDPSVVDFWVNRRPKEVGEIRWVDGGEQLWVGGKLIFNASRIGKMRSVSHGGDVALSATGGKPSSSYEANDDEGSSVWIVYPTGHARKVSPEGVYAMKPLIDTSGHYVAYSGTVHGSGGEDDVKLYITDLRNGNVRTFSGKVDQEHYSVAPAEWVQDGLVLNVLEDYGETGGHMTMRKIRIE